MTDGEAIRTLVHQYCDRVCNNDQSAWLDLWTDDGVWDIGRGPVCGREAIGTATTNGDVGDGRWYFNEFAKAKSGAALFYLGYYDDTYRSVGGEWRFASRTLTWLYQGPPDLSGFFGPPAGYNS